MLVMNEKDPPGREWDVWATRESRSWPPEKVGALLTNQYRGKEQILSEGLRKRTLPAVTDQTYILVVIYLILGVGAATRLAKIRFCFQVTALAVAVGLGQLGDEAAVGMMRRLEHSQKEIVLKERGKLLAWNTVRKR